MFREGLKLLLLKSLLCVIVHAKTFCELVGWVIKYYKRLVIYPIPFGKTKSRCL